MDLTADLQIAAKRDLVAEVARRFGEVRLKVTGTSMLPSVWPGDILTVRRRSAAELLPGQIVLCYRHQEFVAHRLVGKHGDCLVTRGDSLPYEDRPFRDDEVLGQVVSILRDGRPVDPSPARWHSAGCWILRHSELCTRMLLWLRRLTNRGVSRFAMGSSQPWGRRFRLPVARSVDQDASAQAFHAGT